MPPGSAAPRGGDADPSAPPFRLGGAHLLAGVALLAYALVFAFLPLQELIHRGDDAFYYFKVAAQYPELGFWSFDGENATNGVQPLWATLLSGVALALSWIGVTEPEPVLRGFVVFTVLVHVASVGVVGWLLARAVSRGTAVVVAGAMLLPLGAMWIRVWGVESPLYVLCVAASAAYFHLRFREDGGIRRAVVLGGLLGITGLARLNAWLLVPCMLVPWILRGPAPGGFRVRLGRALLVGIVALLVVTPYVVTNITTTGHLLPVSGAVKLVRAEEFLGAVGVESRASPEFARMVAGRWREPLESLVTTRMLDAYWPLGLRVIENEQVDAWPMLFLGVLTLLLPLAAGDPRAWVGSLLERLSRLRPLAYVAAFAALDAVLSIVLYPGEVYAILRWWLVIGELVVLVLAATVVTAALAHAARRLEPDRARGMAVAALTAVFIAHAGRMALQYFDGEVQHPDWSLSWNDAPYDAAAWLAENVPEDAVVGVWNAGVLGYFARQSVVNLDGLINDFEFRDYLADDRVEAYLLARGVDYVADLEIHRPLRRMQERLTLTEVYSRRNILSGRNYKIFRVVGPREARPRE